MKSIAPFVLLAVGGVALVGCDRNSQTSSTTDNATNSAQHAADKTTDAVNDAAHATGQAVDNAAAKASDMAQKASDTVNNSVNSAPDPTAVRRGLAVATDDALTNNGFSSLIKDFDEASRTRFGSPVDSSFTDLNQLIAAIQTAWKDKYNESFDIGAANLNDSTYAVQAGASNVTATGTDAATLVISGGSSTISVPLVKQHLLQYWKIVPPTSLTAEKLHQNLAKELTAIRDSQANWPGDKDSAYRLVARHIAAAIMDTSAGS